MNLLSRNNYQNTKIVYLSVPQLVDDLGDPDRKAIAVLVLGVGFLGWRMKRKFILIKWRLQCQLLPDA